MTPKLRALLRYIAPRVPTSTHLRVVAAKSDFDSYLRLGHPITETPAWCKGREFMYPCAMTEGEWERETRGIWRRARPLAVVAAGDLIAALTFLAALSDRQRKSLEERER